MLDPMRIGLRLALISGVLAVSWPGVTRADTTVCYAPLGKVDRRLLKATASGAEALFGVRTRILAARELPASAYYKPRRRYRAEKILHYLDAEVVPDSGCDAVVGFTASDISTTKGEHVDWGILGLAWLNGPSAVVSTFRMRRGASRDRRARRAVKVGNHELGHVFGAEHHPRDGCLMEDGGGTVRTVDKASGLLCPESREVIEQTLGQPVPALRKFDWKQVLSAR